MTSSRSFARSGGSDGIADAVTQNFPQGKPECATDRGYARARRADRVVRSRPETGAPFQAWRAFRLKRCFRPCLSPGTADDFAEAFRYRRYVGCVVALCQLPAQNVAESRT